MAWKDALELISKLKTPFQLATASNPALLNMYPALARMLGAAKVVAKRGVSTRAKKKKAGAASTSAATTAGSSGTPATDAGQAAGPTEASPAPQRVVTVQG
jgi:hypothetical protein